MSTELIGGNRRWVAAAAGAVVVGSVLLVLARAIRVPSVQTLPVAKPIPSIEIRPTIGADKVLNEEAVMTDQRPLFLPTDRNVRLRPLPRPEAGKSILDEDARRLTYGDTDLKLGLPAPVAIPEKPAEALLGDASAMPLYGFGRVTGAVEALPRRGGFVEVFKRETNQSILTEPLPLEARPPGEKDGANAWRPLEFFAAVNPAGLVGTLVLTERSDVEEINAFFRDYLTRTFRIGERLPPGLYRIVVGP